MIWKNCGEGNEIQATVVSFVLSSGQKSTVRVAISYPEQWRIVLKVCCSESTPHANDVYWSTFIVRLSVGSWYSMGIYSPFMNANASMQCFCSATSSSIFINFVLWCITIHQVRFASFAKHSFRIFVLPQSVNHSREEEPSRLDEYEVSDKYRDDKVRSCLSFGHLTDVRCRQCCRMNCHHISP